MQHRWLPHSGQGVRTRISDDRAWLAYTVAQYVETTNDTLVLDELIPFLEGARLEAGETDRFFEPTVSERASLSSNIAPLRSMQVWRWAGMGFRSLAQATGTTA